MINYKLAFLITLVITLSINCFAQNFAVTIKVSGINEIKGYISISIFSKDGDFPKNGVLERVFVKVDSNNVSYIFNNLPADDYAIAVYHDENSNKKLDSNFLHIPKEGYGFSSNAVARFGPPKFDQAKFHVKENISIEIKLKY